MIAKHLCAAHNCKRSGVPFCRWHLWQIPREIRRDLPGAIRRARAYLLDLSKTEKREEAIWGR